MISPIVKDLIHRHQCFHWTQVLNSKSSRQQIHIERRILDINYHGREHDSHLGWIKIRSHMSGIIHCLGFNYPPIKCSLDTGLKSWHTLTCHHINYLRRQYESQLGWIKIQSLRKVSPIVNGSRQQYHEWNYFTSLTFVRIWRLETSSQGWECFQT